MATLQVKETAQDICSFNPIHTSPGVVAGDSNDNSNFPTTNREEETSLWAHDVFQIKSTHSPGSSVDTLTAKNDRLGKVALLLLFALGVTAGLVNGVILMCNAALCQIQAYLIVIGGSYSTGFVYFLLMMTSLVLAASLVCKYGANEAAGSGLPEFKYLLASEMQTKEYDSLVSRRIFFFKVIGLICSVGGGLSVGSEGPLVHTAACIAHLLMKYVPEFDEILENPSLTKQIFAASAAVGVSSAFNAPVGGLLFSVEVTSTFYLISNYWKSFIAAMAGAVACNLFLITKEGVNSDPLLVLRMVDVPTIQYAKWELFIFMLMGIGFGYLACFYLQLHQLVRNFMLPYNKSYPLGTAVAVAIVTAVMVYGTGAYTHDSVGVIAIVSDVFNTGYVTELRKYDYANDGGTAAGAAAGGQGVSPIGALLANFFIRAFLTLLGTNIVVPAGIFMPVTLIGGILGRVCGHIIYAMGYHNACISSYALVGAVAFASGVTHTISVAVIAVEMTGNLDMLLPCLVVAVIGAGIAKSRGLSVYDQGMVNKGLESFQLLLVGGGKRGGRSGRGSGQGRVSVAASVMDENVVSLPQRCPMLKLIKLLELSQHQTVFPLVCEEVEQKRDSDNDNDNDSNSNSNRRVLSSKLKLLGTIGRRDIYCYLYQTFAAEGLADVVRIMLPIDSADEDDRVSKERLRAGLRKQRSELYGSIVSRAGTLLFTGNNHLGELQKITNSSSSSSSAAAATAATAAAAGDDDDNTDDDAVRAAEEGAGTMTNNNHAASPMIHHHADFSAVATSMSAASSSSQQVVEGAAAGGVSLSAAYVTTMANIATRNIIHQTQSRISSTTAVGNVLSGAGGAQEDAKNNNSNNNNTEEEEVNTTGAASSTDSRIVALMEREVDFESESLMTLLHINRFPFSVAEQTPMEHIYVLFEMVKVSSVFVVSDGGLRGMISRESLLNSLRNAR